MIKVFKDLKFRVFLDGSEEKQLEEAKEEGETRDGIWWLALNRVLSHTTNVMVSPVGELSYWMTVIARSGGMEERRDHKTGMPVLVRREGGKGKRVCSRIVQVYSGRMEISNIPSLDETVRHLASVEWKSLRAAENRGRGTFTYFR